METLEFNFGISALADGVIQAGIILILAIVLVIIGRKLIPRLIRVRIPKIREETPEQLADRSKTLAQVVAQVFSLVVWVLAIIMILSQIGVDITPLLASVGIITLGFSFAAQNIIRDYLNGFYILIEDWYRVGEWVTISGVEGDVEQITLRRTVLREMSGTMHVIPNSQVSMASNQTRDWARINFSVSVAYKENLDRVYAVINEVGQEFKDDPEWGKNLITAPAVSRVSNLGDHGVDVLIRGITKPGEQWALTGEFRKRIKDRFDEEDIEIPWPHTKVYFGDEPVKQGFSQ